MRPFLPLLLLCCSCALTLSQENAILAAIAAACPAEAAIAPGLVYACPGEVALAKLVLDYAREHSSTSSTTASPSLAVRGPLDSGSLVPLFAPRLRAGRMLRVRVMSIDARYADAAQAYLNGLVVTP
jgi:hypothetical protein